MIGDGHIASPPPPHGNIVRGLARWSAGGRGEARQVAERERERESERKGAEIYLPTFDLTECQLDSK